MSRGRQRLRSNRTRRPGPIITASCERETSWRAVLTARDTEERDMYLSQALGALAGAEHGMSSFGTRGRNSRVFRSEFARIALARGNRYEGVLELGHQSLELGNEIISVLGHASLTEATILTANE